MTLIGREVCDSCGRESPIGFSVPDEVWDKGTDGYSGVLCIFCFDEMATTRGVRWDERWDSTVRFWPVSGLAAAEAVR